MANALTVNVEFSIQSDGDSDTVYLNLFAAGLLGDFSVLPSSITANTSYNVDEVFTVSNATATIDVYGSVVLTFDATLPAGTHTVTMTLTF